MMEHTRQHVRSSTGLIICVRQLANERRRYFITTSLTGWAQALELDV